MPRGGAGTNFFQKVTRDCSVSQTDELGYAVLAECVGSAPIIANVFQHGCIMLQTDSGTGTNALYENQGSILVPSWIAIGVGQTSSINGLIGAGTNVTFTGSGTTIDPYVVNASVTGGTGTVTSVATDTTLTGGPITTTGTLGIDLTHANTWSGVQTFSSTSQTNVKNLESTLYADQFTGAGNNDMGDKINTAYAAFASTGGVIRIPSGTYSFSTPIVFGTNNKFVSLIGTGASSTYLKYTPTSGNAITINFGNPTGHLVNEISGFTLQGKTTLVAAGDVNINTSIGIFYGGNQGAVGINTHDMNVNGFGSNMEWGQNAYMLSFNNVASSGGNGGQASRGSLIHIDVANNSGERNVFHGCSFTDPGNSLATNAIYITNAGTASNAFFGCSFDSAQLRIGASNGTTLFSGCHFENPGSPTSYAEYIPILGVSSDSSTQITIIGCEFANSASNQTWTTVIRHGGQLYASGNHIDNYNGKTVTNFVLHDLDNGQATDYVVQTSFQGGALTNIIGGSGGVAYSLASAATALYNVQNSYTIGYRATGSNTNEFFSGSNTIGTTNHTGDWKVGLDTGSTMTVPGKALIYNTNTVLDASQFSGADIGAKVNAAYAYAIGTLAINGVIITIPAGAFSFSTPILIGTDGYRASLRGTPGDGTVLTYTGSNSTKAITINCGFQGDGFGSEHLTYEAIRDITLKGNSSTSANAKIGVYLGGTNGAAGAVLRNVKIETFGQGLVFGANTYHTLCDSVVIRNCAQLMFVTAASNSGESLRFINCFMVDPFDTTYVTANGVQFADSGSASASFFGCSFDDTQVRIGQANNVSFYGTHWENPGSANWGAYTYLSIDSNLATNVSLNGDTFFSTGTTKPTAYFANGGNLTMNGVILRDFISSTVTNMGSLTGSGRVTWSGLNNAVSAITNIVSGVPYSPNGFTTQAGAYQYLDNSAHPFYWTTNTAGGVTGAQTINKTSGTVNFAATATTLVVTNSLVSTSSLVFAMVRTADATATIKSVVPASGSFTITLGAAATAETSVGFFVIN